MINRNEIESIMKILRWELREAPVSEDLSRLMKESDFDRMYATLSRHSLEHLLCDAAWKANIFKREEQRQFVKKQRMRAIYRYIYRDDAYAKITALLEREKIVYLPIKGMVIRDLWPEAWMRTCCDIDIMVKNEDFNRAKTCLTEKLGYRYLGRSSHDISLVLGDPSAVRVELHFDTIEEEYIEKARQVLEELWAYAFSCENGYRYVLSPEMFYFYHIAHMAKHFQHGGCGIRPFLDLWLMQQKMPVAEPEKTALLQKGGLLRFHEACDALVGVWLNGEAPTPLTNALEEFILSGGTYGNIENMVAVGRNQKRSYLSSRLFPPFSSMQERYPSLRKFPILLPVMYLRRIGKMILQGRMRRTVTELGSLHRDAEKREKTEMLLEQLGLMPDGKAVAWKKTRDGEGEK